MPTNHTECTGSCLCGGVTYRVTGPLRDVVACHCGQCRKASGHFVAATRCALADLHFDSDATLVWYRSSDKARRGFCSRCGGNLLWQADGSDHASLSAGTLDAPSGLRLVQHIFVGDKSDYYDIDDDLPRFDGDGGISSTAG